jgi:hypothetical protein
MARERNDDLNTDRTVPPETEPEKVRGVARDEEEYEEAEESDEEDLDQEDDSTF